MSEIDQEVTRLTIQVVSDGCILWEDRLKLFVKPRPNWIPKNLWWKMVNLVLYQTREELK